MDGLLKWAEERPLFTVNEAERASGMERASLREKLSRLSRRGELDRVERGKYTVHDDPMIYATHVDRPSYVTLWSGLRFYGVTTQQPTRVQVMVVRNRSDLPNVRFYATNRLFGFGKQRYRAFEVFVAEEERLLLDCIARDLVPVSEVRDLVATVDIETATAYAKRLGTHAVEKRLGYLFETVRGETVEALHVDDRNYPVLDLSRPSDGETNARWRIRVNTDAV